MQFSAFAGFGQLEFSSRRALGEVIYENLRQALGGDENLGEDTFIGPMSGKLYAMAMGFASVQKAIESVNYEARPGTSNELLEVHERDYRVVPPATATKDQRRSVMAAKVEAAKGCRADVVYDALSELLGSHFIAVRRFNAVDRTTYPSNWDNASTRPGLWKDPEKAGVCKTHTLAVAVTSETYPTPVAVTFNTISGSDFTGGEAVIVDPMKYGFEEVVTLVGDGSGNLSAAFTKNHEAGAMVSSEPWPRAATTGRRLLIVVDATVARSTAWRKRIAATLTILRAVDSWSVVEEYSPGQLGPFIPGEGIPGVTPIVQITTAEAT